MPTKEQALQFAIMLQAGLPASEAVLYFTDSDDPRELNEMLGLWLRSRVVKSAITELQGKSWADMSLDERIKRALDHHYNTLAYFLHSNHYAEVGEKDKAKLDTARNALEAKMAGTAGKGDALSRFFDDINSGKLKLSIPNGIQRPN